MKKYIVEVEAQIYISKPIKLKINNWNVCIEGKNSKKDVFKKIKIEGESDSLLKTPSEYFYEFLKKICCGISVYCDVPVSNFFITSIQKIDDKKKGVIINTRSVRVKASISLPVVDMKNLNQKIKSNFETEVLEQDFFRRALASKSEVERFWLFYLILQMILGLKRMEIDRTLKNRLGLETIVNDKFGQETTKVTVIRDAFSHKEYTYNNGKKPNLTKFIKEVNPGLQGICRELIINKYS